MALYNDNLDYYPYFGYYDPYYGFYGQANYGKPNYAGYGPRNYRRSDTRILDDVYGRLWQDGALDAHNIDVMVNDGVVTLRGTVDSRWGKRQGEDDAYTVPGVFDVDNRLTVTRSQPRPSEGARQQGMNFWRDQVFMGMPVEGSDGDRIGNVETVGEFDFRIDRPWDEDVNVPFEAIQNIIGSRIVLDLPADQVDDVYGTPEYEENNEGPYSGMGPKNYTRSDDQIHQDVDDRLWLDGQLDASDIEVQVENGIVTLRGSVDSHRARRRAEDLAWSVSGVQDVIDELKLRQKYPTWRDQLHQGMGVVGSDGKQIGTVDEIRDFDFKLNRPLNFDLYVPFNAVEDISNDQVRLDIPANRVGSMNWETTATAQAY